MATFDGPPSIDVPNWPYLRPDLDVVELVRGVSTVLAVSDLGEGVEVTFLRSSVGMGRGPCGLAPNLCSALVSPEVLGVQVAGASGRVEIPYDVPSDEPPGAWWFQVLAHDPALGAGQSSLCEERYVALAPSESASSFSMVNEEAGLEKTYTDGNSHTGGIAWTDYNGDYWPDLFISNGGGLAHFLYRNNGDGTFTDVSDLVPKPDPLLEDAGAAFADIDNDGDEDLFIPVDNPAPMNVDYAQPRDGGPNVLYVNRGDGTFDEAAEVWGLVDPEGRRTITGVFADYDLDGLVDLYLGNWAMNSEPVGVQDNFGRLMRNVGGTFVDVTTAAGEVNNDGLDNLTSAWMDLDFDRYPDLYLGNVARTDLPPNWIPDDRYYRNLGNGTFVKDMPAGVGEDAWAAMGIDIADVEGDGDWDVYITDNWETDPLPRGNPFYRTEGGVMQANTCGESGVCTGYSAWPANFVDFDRDGFIDLWVGTQFRTEPELLLMNDGAGIFTPNTVPEFVDNAAHGGAVADYDGDGDVDIFIHNTSGDSRLYANEGIDDGHFIQWKLVGRVSNASAIGAVVRVRTGVHEQIRRVSGGDSAHSQSETILHFGLGDSDHADEVTVVWPSGIEHRFTNTPANEVWFVDELQGAFPEALEDTVVGWSPATETLSVAVRSNFGGRTAFEVVGFGPLRYDASTRLFTANFKGISTPPGTIQVVARRGAMFELPVLLVP